MVPRRPKGTPVEPAATTLSPRTKEPPENAAIMPPGSMGGSSMAGETFSISTVSCAVCGGGIEAWK